MRVQRVSMIATAGPGSGAASTARSMSYRLIGQLGYFRLDRLGIGQRARGHPPGMRGLLGQAQHVRAERGPATALALILGQAAGVITAAAAAGQKAVLERPALRLG